MHGLYKSLRSINYTAFHVNKKILGLTDSVVFPLGLKIEGTAISA